MKSTNLLDIVQKHKRLLLIIFVAVIALVVAIVTTVMLSRKDEKKGITTISEASLKEVIEISELSTLEYAYNSHTFKANGKKTEYYVAYKGMVQLGFDFSQLTVKTDHEAKKIKIKIPEIKVISVHVDEKLDYIFTKEKYNVGEVFAEAYKLCEKDLEKKAKGNIQLGKLAKENAISSLNALLTPWKENLEEGYVIEYV